MQTNEDPKAAKNGLGIAALSAEKAKKPIGSRNHEGSAIAKAWSHIADVTPPDCRKSWPAACTVNTSADGSRTGVKNPPVQLGVEMPSFEGYHRSFALIGLGQTTRSTGGYDFWKNCCLADFAAEVRRIPAKPGEGGGEAGETAQDNAEGIPETGIGEARNGQFSAPRRENRMLAGTAGYGGHSFPSTDFAADYNSGSKGSGSFWMIFSQRSMVSGS